ncbi:unnamed protein product [Ascophyllum nodosum]
MTGMLSFAKRMRENVVPARRNSAFLTKGVLTPAEFLEAGEQLVFKCPTWSWEAGDPSRAKDCFPDKSKQFLVTRNVPCHRRAKALEGEYVGDTEIVVGDAGEDGLTNAEGVEDTWVEPNVVSADADARGGLGRVGTRRGDADDEDEELLLGGGRTFLGDDGDTDLDGIVATGLGAIKLVESHFTVPPEAPVVGGEAPSGAIDGVGSAGSGGRWDKGSDSGGLASSEGVKDHQQQEQEDYPDLDSYVEDNLMQGDEATVQAGPASYLTAQEPEDAILPTRTYDLSITYDSYWQTPRMWLFGYDESGQPLSQEQVFEDVMQDYHRQTVTMELHPHLSSHHASVHPCKHADTMKIILQNLARGGKEARVDQALFVFLKFIQSVVPTIDYDYTMSVDTGDGIGTDRG